MGILSLEQSLKFRNSGSEVFKDASLLFTLKNKETQGLESKKLPQSARSAPGTRSLSQAPPF